MCGGIIGEIGISVGVSGLAIGWFAVFACVIVLNLFLTMVWVGVVVVFVGGADWVVVMVVVVGVVFIDVGVGGRAASSHCHCCGVVGVGVTPKKVCISTRFLCNDRYKHKLRFVYVDLYPELTHSVYMSHPKNNSADNIE